MSAEIEFRSPPPQTSRAYSNGAVGREIAAALRERPGEWAHIGEWSTPYAHQIRQGRIKAYKPAGAFEATARRIQGKPGRSDIYARFVGGDI